MTGGPQGGGEAGTVLAGILLMCLAVTLFSTGQATVKFLSPEYATLQLVWFRYAGQLLFINSLFMPARGWALYRTRHPVIQATRSLLLLASTVMAWEALSHISLATVTAIGFLAPILVVALAAPLLGERVGWGRWAAVLASFGGALVIIRPGFGDTHWAMLLVIGSAMSYALYQVLTRKIAGRDSPETSAAHGALVATVLISLVAFAEWRTPEGLLDWLLHLSLGLFTGFGHYLLARAYRAAPAPVISPFGYMQLVAATVLGYLLFSHLPDIWTVVGSAIIIASGIVIGLRSTGGQKP